MKIEKQYLQKAYRDAAIMQYVNALRSDGYSVEQEKRLDMGTSFFYPDVYAEKKEEKRVYEFKLIGNIQEKTENIERFREYAGKIGAIPSVVYINPPEDKNIEIDDLSDKIYSYITSGETPDDLAILSPCTTVDDVCVDEVSDISISPEHITATGDAIVYVELDYDDDVKMTENFPMTFTVKMDRELTIEDFKYAIDTSSWYELEPDEVVG